MTRGAVVFDIGNVLIEWHPERFYDAAIGPARRQRLFRDVDLAAMNLAIDAGAPFRETVLDWAVRYPDWGAEIRLWHDNWIDMASPRIEGSVALMRALRRRGVPVLALSNFGGQTFALAQGHYDFLNDFDRAFVSGHMGLLKPDPRIYQAVEQETGLAPRQMLFTDDRDENVAAAAARGWRTHLFRGWQGLARRLVQDGLLNEEDITT